MYLLTNCYSSGVRSFFIIVMVESLFLVILYCIVYTCGLILRHCSDNQIQ